MVEWNMKVTLKDFMLKLVLIKINLIENWLNKLLRISRILKEQINFFV